MAGQEMPQEICLLQMFQVSAVREQLSLMHREVIYSVFVGRRGKSSCVVGVSLGIM